jgi:hypothetical protein
MACCTKVLSSGAVVRSPVERFVICIKCFLIHAKQSLFSPEEAHKLRIGLVQRCVYKIVAGR